ncbi:MAG: MCE family protein [Actinomycetota bacterium]|nr:MCE family protein [Actinomycetota bacterium]
MKTFAERNPMVVGAIASAAVSALVLGGLSLDKVMSFAGGDSYSAYFADAGVLTEGADVQVSGVRVGSVSTVRLTGSEVLVEFTVGDDIVLGDRTEAAIRTNTLLGTKILQVTPRGSGNLSGPIPLDRTTSPYSLTDALSELTTTVGDLNTEQLSDSLATLAKTFEDTPPNLRLAVQGVTRFAKAINNRDAQLRELLAHARKATGVLGQRTEQIVGLIQDTNLLLAELRTESGSLESIAHDIRAMSVQLSGFVAENGELRGTLDRLNGVLTIVDNRKEQVQEGIKLLNAYAMSLGEAVASGPFFNAYVANLLPGQFSQPFIDAAFSDLGLDPNVLLPSEVTDPPVGQPGTPALPAPYPRTGQGGPPNLTLPDAITGKPGDPRYPYREPPPAPEPGGPPPGPPAPAPPGLQSTPEPTPAPVYHPAPDEVSPSRASAERPGSPQTDHGRTG